MLKKDEFYQWKMDPVGQQVYAEIARARQEWVDELVTGDSDAVDTARIRGIIRGLDSLLEFEVSE